jgi:ubiquinone biosynthesis protein UbiJ
MDIPTLIAYVGIILALIWAGYERVRAGRNKNAQYVESLAEAAHDLVKTYREQVQDLHKSVEDLQTRLARLEQQLENFGCLKAPDCPLREWVRQNVNR